MNQFSLKETLTAITFTHCKKKKEKKLCDCVGSRVILTLLCVSGGLGG